MLVKFLIILFLIYPSSAFAEEVSDSDYILFAPLEYQTTRTFNSRINIKCISHEAFNYYEEKLQNVIEDLTAHYCSPVALHRLTDREVVGDFPLRSIDESLGGLTESQRLISFKRDGIVYITTSQEGFMPSYLIAAMYSIPLFLLLILAIMISGKRVKTGLVEKPNSEN